MQNRTDKATAAPIDKERPISVSQELPAWTPARPPDDPAPISAPLRRLLADMPDEYRREPLGVIEAEVRRIRREQRADSTESPPA
jgi:hypothetical protein